ncbi:oligosaccharide flippase family protein, partial [candidate division WWE3 bacterium]|nr:oligosaccharide flippase family protein [candidate division WWE3 bacterium]
MQKLLTIYHHIKNDSLYRNSVFLLINTVILAFFGFFFWAICTRVFSTEDIGIATTLISSVDLVAVFALLGLNVSVIRYLPKSENKNSSINSVLITVGITAIIGSIIYVIGINRFAPELSFIKSNKIFVFAFGLFVVFTCWSQILKNIFRAYLSTQYVVLKNSIFNILKIGFIFVFTSLGAFGILTSWMTALTIAVLISIIILIHTFGYRP